MSQSNKEDLLLYDLFSFSPIKTAEDVKSTFSKVSEKSRMVCNDTYVGIEVEVEGITNHVISGPYWSSVEDGSLRNNGREFVSVPLRGQSIEKALTQLSKFLDESNGTHDFSERTSIHVHVNARDMKASQIFGFILTYLVFEPMLYKFVYDTGERDRSQSIFCVPVGVAGNTVGLYQALQYFDKGNAASAITYLAQSWKKYTGMNCIPLIRKGTLEFRQMAGTKDVEKIIEWINILLRIKKFAVSREFNYIRNKILALNTNSMYHNFMEDVFSSDSFHFSRYDERKDLEQGVIAVKRALTEWSAKGEKMKAEVFNKSSLAKFLRKRGFDYSNLELIEKRKTESEKAEKLAAAAYAAADKAFRKAEQDWVVADQAERNARARAGRARTAVGQRAEQDRITTLRQATAAAQTAYNAAAQVRMEAYEKYLSFAAPVRARERNVVEAEIRPAGEINPFFIGRR